ncbi:MAG: NADH-quinone oxidoreductase subunit NuoF [Kiritimatiellae bacterium]|nr:NADH-quinone oxidoreductase subunit NuoF [Kiritimatiellia bacterium]
MIDEITYGFVEPGKVGDVLCDFLEAQKAEEKAGAAIADGKEVEGEVRLCLCASCMAGGSAVVHGELLRQVEDLGLCVKVKVVGCTGMSYQAPMIEIALEGAPSFRYGLVRLEDVKTILLRHFRPVSMANRVSAAVSRILERLLDDDVGEPVTRYAMDLRHGPDSMYCGRQEHISTEHCGELDPLDIDEYKESGGFLAMKRCLTERSPDEVIKEVADSGLRGRGGAGFSTGIKWATVAEQEEKKRYLICNGDEGDPGAFMDRMILESFPFRVLEGIGISAYAIGATDCYLYIRAEYPLAAYRVEEAIQICERNGILGENVMGTGRSLRLKVVKGAGAFVCGEETALIAAIEGRRGMPRLRPPYPAEKGLWGKPTLVNNVETYALVPWIMRHGAGAFAGHGTAGSKGTKAFALAGKVVRGGLIEVPMGITLREIVEDIGGGVQGGKRLKAVQVGGPSGGCVPAHLADTPVDYDELVSAGAIMGSGGMIVLDDSDCMVDIARYFLAFTQLESCGKCTFCRIGTKRMLEILNNLCEGRGKPGDIARLERLSEMVQEGSLCQLGGTAPNPVQSTIKHFREEYEAHIDGRCPALKCKALIEYRVTDKCIGCTICAQNCPVDAIEMRPYERHEIDSEKCTRCDACRQGCLADAIEVGARG